MKKNLDYKIFLVGGEKVKIMQSFTHTYVVQYESGLEQNVHKSYVKSYYPNRTKSKKKSKRKNSTLKKFSPQKPKKSDQTSLEF